MTFIFFHLAKSLMFFLPVLSLQRLNKFTVELIGDSQHKQFLFQVCLGLDKYQF